MQTSGYCSFHLSEALKQAQRSRAALSSAPGRRTDLGGPSKGRRAQATPGSAGNRSTGTYVLTLNRRGVRPQPGVGQGKVAAGECLWTPGDL